MRVQHDPRGAWAYYELIDKEPRPTTLPMWKLCPWPHPVWGTGEPRR